MFRLLLYLLVIVFVLLTVAMGLVNYGTPEFAPRLSAAYSVNFWPRLWVSLQAGAEQAIAIMVGSAAWIAHAVAVIIRFIAGIIAAIIDAFSAPEPVSTTPSPSPPSVTSRLPTPVLPPSAAPATAGSGFLSGFLLGFLNGFVLVLAARTLLYAGGWYFAAYKVRWTPGRYSRERPVLDFRSKATANSFLWLHLFCLIAAILFLFGGGFPGYSGAIVGFASGAVLPIVPRSIFLGLRLLNIDPDRVRPLRTEQGEIIRLSIRHDGAIVAATFRKAWRTIAEGTALSDKEVLLLARIAIAFRTLEGRPRDADLLERYLYQRAPDWRQQAAEAEAAEEDEQPGQQSPSQGMTRAEALVVLGLKNDATDDAIDETYKRLIKRLHPDLGGSDFFAKQLNEARDVLLG
jgi:hypothetical protein